MRVRKRDGGWTSGGAHPAFPDHWHDGDGARTTAIEFSGNTASTFLTHFFGSGLAEEFYVVETFTVLADGDMRRLAGEAPAKTKSGKRKVRRATATLNAVMETGRICPSAWQRYVSTT